jgi:hypothetical protein
MRLTQVSDVELRFIRRQSDAVRPVAACFFSRCLPAFEALYDA